MIALVQRVSSAKLSVERKVYSSIGRGLLVLLSVSKDDYKDDNKDDGPNNLEPNLELLAKKLLNLKMFPNQDERLGEKPEKSRLEKSLLQVGGEILLVSQFTLYADTKKGVRPSFSRSAPKDKALKLFELFRDELNKTIPGKVALGKFGSEMMIEPVLEGPVSFILQS